MRVWAEWALRQIVRFHNLAMRELWRERQFQAAIHGADMGEEPKWDLGGDGAPAFDDEFERLKAARRGVARGN